MPKKTGQNIFFKSIDVWRQHRLEKYPLILSPPAAKSVIQRQICCKKNGSKTPKHVAAFSASFQLTFFFFRCRRRNSFERSIESEGKE